MCSLLPSQLDYYTNIVHLPKASDDIKKVTGDTYEIKKKRKLIKHYIISENFCYITMFLLFQYDHKGLDYPLYIKKQSQLKGDKPSYNLVPFIVRHKPKDTSKIKGIGNKQKLGRDMMTETCDLYFLNSRDSYLLKT